MLGVPNNCLLRIRKPKLVFKFAAYFLIPQVVSFVNDSRFCLRLTLQKGFKLPCRRNVYALGMQDERAK